METLSISVIRYRLSHKELDTAIYDYLLSRGAHAETLDGAIVFDIDPNGAVRGVQVDVETYPDGLASKPAEDLQPVEKIDHKAALHPDQLMSDLKEKFKPSDLEGTDP